MHQVEQKLKNVGRFYTDLYKSEEPQLKEIDQRLRTLLLPEISSSHWEILTLPITLKEIEDGISSLKPNRASGPDG